MVAKVKAKVNVDKIQEQKIEVRAFEEQLAAMKAELEGLADNVVSLNNEAAINKNEIQALFSAQWHVVHKPELSSSCRYI